MKVMGINIFKIWNWKLCPKKKPLNDLSLPLLRERVSQPHFGISVWGWKAHTPKSGKLESSETPENSELEFRGQNTLHCCVPYTIGKVLKCRCPKWPRMSHLDICSPSYGQKRGRESNWQFDSRPLKLGNQPLPDVWSRSATWRWKFLDESYNFGSNLVPIRTWGEKLWTPKVLDSIDIEVLFYHGSKSLLTHLLLFLWPINYNYTFRCNKFFTPSLPIWFWLKIWFFSFLWNYGVTYSHVLRAPSCTSEWRTIFGIIFRFDIDATSSWWRSRTSKGARSFWNWTLSSLVLSYFFELSHLGDFVTSWPYFWWWT